jgi:hypothetical protein
MVINTFTSYPPHSYQASRRSLLLGPQRATKPLKWATLLTNKSMATLELVSHDTYLSTSEVEGDGRYLPVTHTTVNTESFRLSSLPTGGPSECPSSWYWKFPLHSESSGTRSKVKSRLANGCFKRASPRLLLRLNNLNTKNWSCRHCIPFLHDRW